MKSLSIFLCRMTQAMLKSICETLALERSGSKEMHVSRIMEFLMKPKDAGKAVPVKRRRELDIFIIFILSLLGRLKNGHTCTVP